ncbi:MAG: hypothetical protein KDK04_03090 [Candidatus Competibacteraceae bacterium]|nr:hypothetical protein [Caldilineaceae bacterium]MCB1810697.1 hypothetical protein [Candidatus Competibacteraceae bacterium]
MSDEVEVKTGYTPDDVQAMVETLRGMVDLEEGELYTLRRGMLHHIAQRNDDNGLRRIKIMEEAYDAAQLVARRLRSKMRGYRPDPALVISAFVMHMVSQDGADDVAMAYLQRLFQASTEDAADSKSVPDEVAA